MTVTEAHEKRRRAKAKLIRARAEDDEWHTPASNEALSNARAGYDVTMLSTQTEKERKIIEVCGVIDENIAKLKALMKL